jgi:hypothetical protein
MPSFAEGDQETKELIASMSQLDSSGVATIQVKDMETGQISEKNVEELTPEDIADLKKANEESSQSIEQIAIDQLDITKQINATLQSGELMGKFARATSPTMEKLTNFVSGSYKDVATKFRDELGTTQGLRGKFEGVAGPTEDFLVAAIEGNTANQTKAIADFTKGAIEIKDSFLSASESFVQNIIESRKEDLKKTYSSDYKPANQPQTINVNVKVEGDANTAKLDKNQVTTAVLQGLQDPNYSNAMSYTIDGGSAPSAATGKKN